MAEPPPTFLTLAAELQVMILAKVFENAVIDVKYPYQSLREISYEDMKLQGDLGLFLVSKSFYEAAKIALFQTATFRHYGFYLGRGQRKSSRLQNAAPEAFRHFRHIKGHEAFSQQFVNACQNGRWPYEDLRSITVMYQNNSGVHGRWAKIVRENFNKLQEVVSEYGVEVTFLVNTREVVPTSRNAYWQIASIEMVINKSRCSIEQIRDVPLASYHSLQDELKENFGDFVSMPAVEANEHGEMWYEGKQLNWA